MINAQRVANGRFARGFNCAQSIFSAFAEQFGISSELAVRLAAPFGGGISRQGEVCGALSGALMVLGLQYGQDRPEGKDEIYRIGRAFMQQFQRQHGSIRCRDLIGQDISTPQGLQSAREQNLFATLCPVLVDDTARALAEYISNRLVV